MDSPILSVPLLPSAGWLGHPVRQGALLHITNPADRELHSVPSAAEGRLAQREDLKSSQNGKFFV